MTIQLITLTRHGENKASAILPKFESAQVAAFCAVSVGVGVGVGKLQLK